jgi:hypothetical protein
MASKIFSRAEAAMGAKHEIHPHILNLDHPGKDAPVIFCGNKCEEKSESVDKG